MLNTPAPLRALAAVLALLLTVGESVPAQSVATTNGQTRWLATRAELVARAAEFDLLSASTAYGSRTREQARAQAVEMRRRLTDGDFRLGDEIALRIEGQVMLDDTVTVSEGIRIMVRGFRQVELAGVLRSELELKLREDLAENVRNATITAWPLMRVAVFGPVENPGYHSVSDETTLDQLLMRAGGPVEGAAVEKMSLLRADAVLFTPAEVTEMLARGVTLGTLGVVTGDALVVPVSAPPWDRSSTLQVMSFFVGPLLTVLLVRR